MNDYLIKSHHLVFEDNFNKGEGKQVNSYMVQGQVTAENLAKAVEAYYEHHLYYTFKKDNIADDEQNEHFLHDSVCVDIDNYQASESYIEKWKTGKIKLYSNNFTMEIFELVPVTTDKFFEKPTQ